MFNRTRPINQANIETNYSQPIPTQTTNKIHMGAGATKSTNSSEDSNRTESTPDNHSFHSITPTTNPSLLPTASMSTANSLSSNLATSSSPTTPITKSTDTLSSLNTSNTVASTKSSSTAKPASARINPTPSFPTQSSSDSFVELNHLSSQNSNSNPALQRPGKMSHSLKDPPPNRMTYTYDFGIYVSSLCGRPPLPGISIMPPSPGTNSASVESSMADPSTHCPSTDSQHDIEPERDSIHDGANDLDDSSSLSALDDTPQPFNEKLLIFPHSICPSRDERHLLVSNSNVIYHLNMTRHIVDLLSSSVSGALWRDPKGNIFIADEQHHCIRMISVKGELSHIAGSKKGQFGHVNGTAMKARFYRPSGICSNGGDSSTSSETPADASASTVEADGKSSSKSKSSSTKPILYFICDQGNHCIRVLTDKGVVSTLTGPGPEPLIRDSTAASSSSPLSFQIHPLHAPIVNGPVNIATFHSPSSCAFNHRDQSLIVVDSDANCIRRITSAGLVWTMAGVAGQSGFTDGPSYEARFSHPHSIVIDAAERVFISDTYNHAIRVITPAGLVHTIAGNGQSGYKNGSGHTALLSSPMGLCLDKLSNLYVCDSSNGMIRKIQFISLPTIPLEIAGPTTQILFKEWVEYKERANTKQKQLELKNLQLERTLLEQRKEFHSYKKSVEDEFIRVRQEQMQIMRQLISSMQNISSNTDKEIIKRT